MAVRAASLRHFLRELLSVRIGVTLRARLLRHVEVRARPCSGMARGARGRRVLAGERKLRRCMQRDSEERRTEPRGGMTRRALSPVALRELACVLVGMAVRAAPEGELSVARRPRQLGLMASRAGRALVLSAEW